MNTLKIFIFVLSAVFAGGAFADYRHHHHYENSGWDAFWYGLGHGLTNPYYPRYYYDPPRVYYPPYRYYYAPRRPYCYSVDIGGYYDYYGRYIPNIMQQCDYH